MHILKDTACAEIGADRIGGKAANLVRLQKIGFDVPRWIVIPLSSLAIPTDTLATDEIEGFIDETEISEDLLEEISGYFPDDHFFAVRSSAAAEDGSEYSFAGQFETRLFVSADSLKQSIKAVWKSAWSERVREYVKINGLKVNPIAIIVQQMIAADASGVGFSVNPVNGHPGEQVINSVWGLGEGLVSGELDADHFVFRNNRFLSKIAFKKLQVVPDKYTNQGTRRAVVSSDARERPSLAEAQLVIVRNALLKCREEFGVEQDIEFAFRNDQFFLLQARPVTGVRNEPDRMPEHYILWDNSNIIESYPGVTTPLTFSFISESYKHAYELFCGYLGVDQEVILRNETVFANTLGLINGRVYYNLKSWYLMLAMLPGYSINARFMETMMGVKERFDIPDTYRLSRSKAWWSILKMATRMFFRYRQLPRKRKQFFALLEQTISEYKQIDFEDRSAVELMELYRNFESRLLNQWKAPLLNDFFAMIWFGLLQKQCTEWISSENPNIHNDLLCGSQDIISVQPIHRTISIASGIQGDEELSSLFRTRDADAIWEVLLNSEDPKMKQVSSQINSYLKDFGERCVGELKLETWSYTQQPALFVSVVKSYIMAGISFHSASEQTEETIRRNAELEVKEKLKRYPLRRWRLRRTLSRARDLVSSRENLRYERTRAFGVVRLIFSHIGSRFADSGLIDDERDIFFLSMPEVFAFIEGRAVTQDIRALIDLRKSEFDTFRKMPAPAERFATYGTVYDKNRFFENRTTEEFTGDLKGIGCCPGRVVARARVVGHPSEVQNLEGDILITTSTDPGWVTLFPSAGGILVERGSLLSHSAIVSREMGIPCVVGITGLLKFVRTGDLIEMNGSTGTVKVLESNG